MNSTLRYHFPENNHGPLFLIAFILVLLFSSFVNGQTYPTGFSQSLVTGSITDPTALAFAPASDGRIFITEQSGNLRVIKNGVLLTTPAVQLSVGADGERGLIGVTVDPDFTNNHYIYLYHTVPTGTVHNRIVRFTMDGDVVASGSDVIVLDLDPLSSATNHNGGAMAFGPDGKLYVGIGENANGANAQDLDTYLGKVLRINSDGSVPAGNPFSGSAQKQRVWAYGLRNPYTINFHPGTGALFVNDVGETTWEEINDATTSGHNFGWPSAEGVSGNSTYTNPVYVYSHGNGDGLGCAITGGTFFSPAFTNYPSHYSGKYFFLDLCEKWINYIDPTLASPTRNAFATGISGDPLGVMTGPDGNLYYLSRVDNSLYKIVYNGATAVKANQPNSGSHVYPQPATEFLNVELNSTFSSYSVNFTDALGNTQTVPFSVEGKKLLINVSSLASGVYALRISDSDKTITQQVSLIR